MKVGLVDVDGHNFPNLPLMKLSAWHKQGGDQVEWCNPLLPYDKVYLSKVFDFTPDFTTAINAKEMIKGGIAYGLDNKLPKEIEHIYPDYPLYNIKNIAYGFLTRGCPRNCDFCNVSQHQGNKAVKVADLKEFWSNQKEIKLLDPNLLACKDKYKLLQQLIDSNSWIDFTQGLD
ncbi:MAG: radical SAM protein, partial [Candidatus Heimdallarchaeaceae archaeon]